MKKQFIYFLRGIFLPHYCEASLFLVCFTFIVLYICDVTLRSAIRAALFDVFFFEKNLIGLIYLLPIAVIFFYGFFLSLYHAFSSRPKSYSEKNIMILFAGIVNGIAGIAAGIYMLEHSTGGLSLFPVLNFINALANVNHIVFADKKEDIKDVEDRDAELPEIFIGVFITLALLLVCRYVFKMYWAFTFSICVVYATNLNRLVQKVLLFLSKASSKFLTQNLIPRSKRLTARWKTFLKEYFPGKVKPRMKKYLYKLLSLFLIKKPDKRDSNNSDSKENEHKFS